MNHFSHLKRLSFVATEEAFRSIALSVDPSLSRSITPEKFRDLYRSKLCDQTGWPKAFKFDDAKKVDEGIVVKSISGEIEGRTTGSRSKCKAIGCPGWFVGVLWETGQQMFLCSEGWHYDPQGDGHIDLIGGGEISARFVSPKPLGENPAPKSEWPTRRELRLRKGWRVNP